VQGLLQAIDEMPQYAHVMKDRTWLFEAGTLRLVQYSNDKARRNVEQFCFLPFPVWLGFQPPPLMHLDNPHSGVTCRRRSAALLSLKAAMLI
jgi:hypothetical protein